MSSVEGEMERVRIEWNSEMDKRLLKGIEYYVAEYDVVYDLDMHVVSTIVFERPDYWAEVADRYRYLKDALTIETCDDYDEYHSAQKKAGWILRRKCMAEKTLRDRNLQKVIGKESWRAVAANVQSDLIMVFSEVSFDTILSRTLWEYLGGNERISFMGYLDVVAQLVKRLPPSLEFCRNVNQERIKSEMVMLKKKYGVVFDRRLRKAGTRLVLKKADKQVHTDWKPICPQRLIFLSSKEMAGQTLDGCFSLSEWRLILTNCKGTLWQFTEPKYKNKSVFMEEMARRGVTTAKTNNEVLLEFCSTLLPKFWLLDNLMDSNGILDSHYAFKDAGKWACVTIYHSLTMVSVKHVRKTILYLLSVGVLINGAQTVNEWFSYFMRKMVFLSCGECWRADPLEFEEIRSRLKAEVPYDFQYCPCEECKVDMICTKGSNCKLAQARNVAKGIE